MKFQMMIASATALIAAACATTASEKPVAKFDAKTQGYVDRMLANSFQIRTGRYEVANDAVKMMEAAVAEDPGNAEVQAQLGNAYMLQATFLGQPGHGPMEPFNAMNKGYAAYEKALALDPDNLVAIGGHGTAAIIYSMIRQKPELGVQGLAEMDRAIDLAPKSKALVQHLLRVQTLINLPANMRSYEKEMADIAYIVPRAKETRQGDFMRIIEGDINIEAARPDLARAAYALAAKSPRPGGDLARKRLAALDAGAVPAADIAAFRKDLGQCTTCHGG